METALDDVAFLALSTNRIAVLESLVDRALHTRDDLMEETDVSRPTLARILDDLERRVWISQQGQTCRITPLGAWLYEEFAELLEAAGDAGRLREVIQWLPMDEVTFDVRCLRDAEIILLDAHDITALIRRILEFQRSGEWVRAVAREAAPEVVETQWEVSVLGDTRVELVVTPEALTITEECPETARRVREMLEEGNAQYYVSEDIPVSVAIVDDAVGINLADESGVLRGGVVTDHEAVYEWALDLFESCRKDARPLRTDAIPA